MTWYAWSPIDYGAEVDKESKSIISRKVVAVGEEVTPDKLGMEEDSPEWKALVDGGSVRDYEFPEELQDTNTSAQKIVSARLRAMEDGVDTGQLDSSLVANLMKRPKSSLEGSKEIDPETGEVRTADNPPPPASTGGSVASGGGSGQF